MERKSVTVDEIITTFSSHISSHYPSPNEFKRNFKLLLDGKRARAEGGAYAVSLEKNIVFLSCLVREGESFVERLLGAGSGEAAEGEGLAAALERMEKSAHERTAQLHRKAFIEGNGDEFKELSRDRSTPGQAYLDKLEFNYRYLMTLRIFLFELLSVVAAIRSQYAVSAAPDMAQRLKSHLELTVHYYLGNVAVGEGSAPEPTPRPPS